MTDQTNDQNVATEAEQKSGNTLELTKRPAQTASKAEERRVEAAAEANHANKDTPKVETTKFVVHGKSKPFDNRDVYFNVGDQHWHDKVSAGTHFDASSDAETAKSAAPVGDPIEITDVTVKPVHISTQHG